MSAVNCFTFRERATEEIGLSVHTSIFLSLVKTTETSIFSDFKNISFAASFLSYGMLC